MKPRSPIAVVGMAGVFPGASDIETFWRNIVSRKNATVDVPEGRWIVPPEAMFHPDFMPDKAFSGRACLVTDFRFDPSGLNLPPSLLMELDPLYHMVLHAGREAFRSCAPEKLDLKRVGVALAAIALPTDASSRITREIPGRALAFKLFGENEPLHLSFAQCLAGRVTSLPGAILARALGLGGGSFTLDAACASSIYAVKQACDELRAGRLDAVLAGGVSRPECLYTQVGFSQLRALSPSGRCAPFDASADGLVVGEGAGILVLKRLEDAISHGDRIYGVIRGIGLSNDMRGNLLAPDSEGQVRAMRKAYDMAGWSPNEVDHIECHGAGTPVGDAVEVNSLVNLWGESGWREGQCAIGSIKSVVGHLLTGAGAAGMIKTLLGLHYKTLPPSLHFTRAPENSPLHHSPFRVQTEAEPWEIPDGRTTRRAAVSGFGFGGINAHILFEEFSPSDAKSPETRIQVSAPVPEKPPEIAIIGMGVTLGSLKNLRAFQEAVLNGQSAIARRPAMRWKGMEAVVQPLLGEKGQYGAYLENMSVYAGEFHIPPNEIPDILPQQLLMLRAGAEAMRDAGLPLRGNRPEMGLTIGIDFDMEATDFHLRWSLFNAVERWQERLNLEDEAAQRWLEELRDACGPPLTATRVQGALGGIVASRVAREFQFGGPCYTVSGEAASGIRALETGVRSLQQGETDCFLAGAVDLCGDVRTVSMLCGLRNYSESDRVLPFDRNADGTLPGEGAVAVILKRVEDAVRDGNRIYARVSGLGYGSGGGIDRPVPEKSAYRLSLTRALADARMEMSGISYIEAHGSGDPVQDQVEAAVLHEIFPENGDCPAVGSLKPVTGDTGAASGLASVVKTALCLYQEILPPLPGFSVTGDPVWQQEKFHIPAFPQFWIRNRKDGARRACVAAMSQDGTCSHVILEGAEINGIRPAVREKMQQERRRPLGFHIAGLFVIEGDSPDELLRGLDALERHIQPYGDDLESCARKWYLKNRSGDSRKARAVAIVAKDRKQLPRWIDEARLAVRNGTPKKMVGPSGISYFPEPLGHAGRTAFVFPGSGNHYVGMGRIPGVRWPEILRQMDSENAELKTQMIPECYTPRRVSWETGWEEDAYRKINADPMHMIFGQVFHGGVMANLVSSFGIKPDAVIGYSLGESAGLFATRAWPDRGEMLRRMRETDLFTTELAGPCHAARKIWQIPENEDVDWKVAVVNRPADRVRKIIEKWPLVRLLIVNTPDECVIGGQGAQVYAAIEELNCEAIFLEGVVTVHCDAALPAAMAYRELHVFPTTAPQDIQYYSCAFGRAHDPLTGKAAADSILQQATQGFDFPAVIEKMYADGIRIFMEMGPQSSCKRMIERILKGRPHSALSVCARGEDDYLTLLKFLGTLIAERVPVNMDALYGDGTWPPALIAEPVKPSGKALPVKIGGRWPLPPLPAPPEGKIAPEPVFPAPAPEIPETEIPVTENLLTDDVPNMPKNEPVSPEPFDQEPTYTEPVLPEPEIPQYNEPPEMTYPYEPGDFSTPDAINPFAGLIGAATEANEQTAQAHMQFLDFAGQMNRRFGDALELQNQLLAQMLTGGLPRREIYPEALYAEDESVREEETFAPDQYGEPVPEAAPPEFPREMCMEFAIGSIEKVLGPEFAAVDTYPVRVRLPDEPLMLVDRILFVEGEKGSMTSGRVVTEHDVFPGAWYLDGDRSPVCISVEAGQADLFLCSYLGIDLKVRGKRAYRLLDAKVRFHRGLPRSGETIRYDIHIDRFIRQGEVYLFMFRFEGTINGEPLISMRDGCAGFFTKEEVENSGGIILTEAYKNPPPGKKDFTPLVPVSVESYDDQAIEALRQGDLAGCFGPDFTGIVLPESLRLPGGRMRLMDRVLHLDPAGGRFGLGVVRAEADIHPDDWFLTCHFVDDMVMPGTLMYECCAHTLRVLLQRIGWVTDKADACYEPVCGVEAVLKCRGPVTPATRKVIYEVEIREIGYNPEPYVVADALMYGDGERIVQFEGMSMKLTGATRHEIESFWAGRRALAKPPKTERYTRKQLLAFCEGNPSEAFGEPYRIFDMDQERKIARLPRPPYFFMDRVTLTEPEPWVLKAGGWIEAEYEMTGNEWYFRADRSGAMPFCVLLEIALQPCGWLAAYAGSALRSDIDMKFRNLGGKAVLCRNLRPAPGILTMRSRMTQVSEAGGMIIENFDMQVLQDGEMIYEGDTYFGFFSAAALANQLGIQGAKQTAYEPSPEEAARGRSFMFENEAPLFPDDENLDAAPPLAMPSKALRMVDGIELYIPDGGPHGLGFVRGVKTVDVNEWFFHAHFYEDPVCPGSLGLESFLQLMKFAALDRWGHLADTHRFEMVTEAPHEWVYRGQIIQKNRRVEVDAVITRVEESPCPALWAEGYLKVDGLFIYQMKNFGLRLVAV